MCKFIQEPNVMPGWGCCRCKVYNGLQRHGCKACKGIRHVIEIPETTPQCSSCGFGMERPGQYEHCPVCQEKLPTKEREGHGEAKINIT